MGYFVNIFWKIRENFTIGGFREGRSDYTSKHYYFCFFRILEECYFIDMRISLYRWEWMQGSFSPEKCLSPLIFCLKIVSFSKIRTSGNSLYQKPDYGNDNYHAFAFIEQSQGLGGGFRGFQHIPRDLANVAPGFQHLPRNLANVNELQNHV